MCFVILGKKWPQIKMCSPEKTVHLKITPLDEFSYDLPLSATRTHATCSSVLKLQNDTRRIIYVYTYCTCIQCVYTYMYSMQFNAGSRAEQTPNELRAYMHCLAVAIATCLSTICAADNGLPLV